MNAKLDKYISRYLGHRQSLQWFDKYYVLIDHYYWFIYLVLNIVVINLLYLYWDVFANWMNLVDNIDVNLIGILMNQCNRFLYNKFITLIDG